LAFYPILVLAWIASAAVLIPGEGGWSWLTNWEVTWCLEQDEESQERSGEEKVESEDGPARDQKWNDHDECGKSAHAGWNLYGCHGEAAKGHAAISSPPPKS